MRISDWSSDVCSSDLLFSVRRVSRLSCTDSCSVAWITIRIGWRAPWLGDGTHCAIGLRGGAWLQADSARASRARTVRRRIGMRGIAARGRGECKSWGWPWFGLIRKAPLPNPSGPPAQLACVRWRANQWFANAPPHPLPSQGRGLKLAAWAAPTRSRSRKGGEACFVPHSPFPPLTLDRVVHLVLERMRRRAERGDFLHLQPDVGVDEIVGHHPAGLEELAVGVERLECLVERVAHGRDVLFRAEKRRGGPCRW